MEKGCTCLKMAEDTWAVLSSCPLHHAIIREGSVATVIHEFEVTLPKYSGKSSSIEPA